MNTHPCEYKRMACGEISNWRMSVADLKKMPKDAGSRMLDIKILNPVSFFSFTIVELLVVIAIISILATLLLPVLSKAKDMSKGIVCMNNLKQIGLAQTGYSMDNADWIVLSSFHEDWYGYWYNTLSGSDTNPPSGSYGTIHKRMSPFNSTPVMPTGTFECPSEQVKWGSYNNTPPNFTFTHYGVNPNVCGSINAAGVGKGYKTNKVVKPSIAYFAADTNGLAQQFVKPYMVSFRHGASDPRSKMDFNDSISNTLPFGVFKGRGNLVYFDGHVEGYTLYELFCQKDENGTARDWLSAGRAGLGP